MRGARLALIGRVRVLGALAALGGLGACVTSPPGLPPDAALPAAFDAALVDTATALDGGDLANGVALGPYAEAGPETVVSFEATVSGGGPDFTVHGYRPSAAGARAAVVLASGLSQPAAAYAIYGRRLASHGIIALLRDDPGILVDTPTVKTSLAYLVTTWLPAQASAGGLLEGRVDLTRVGLAGHSRGGKASLLAAEGSLKGKVKAWGGLDPVDSPVLAGGEQARDALATIGIPTLFIGTTVTSTCSPAADNYAVMFAAAAAPSASLALVGAGHTQLEDAASCAACGLCAPSGNADGAATLSRSVRYLTAFFARELLGDVNVGAGFDGAGAAVDLASGAIERALK